jgi:hypothetical protein
VTKNDLDFFYVFRDCDGVLFRIQTFVIPNLKYLHMLPTILTRSQFIICSCLFNICGRVSGFCDNMLMYGFFQILREAQCLLGGGRGIIGIVTTVQTRRRRNCFHSRKWK